MRSNEHYSSSSENKIAFTFTSLSAVHTHDFHIFTVIYSSPHGFIWNQHNDQLRWLVSPVGRALHWYRRGHGLKSRTCLNFFFQAFFPLLLKLCSLVRRSLSYSPKLIIPHNLVVFSHRRSTTVSLKNLPPLGN